LFTGCLVLSSLPLLYFWTGPQFTPQQVLIFVSASFLFMSVLAIGLATYTAENYPNHLRALGGGVAGAWQRLASMVGPLMVGWVLGHGGVNAVFGVFGLFALAGGIIALIWANETRGQVLEELSQAA
jgi:putative MFS transporter